MAGTRKLGAITLVVVTCLAAVGCGVDQADTLIVRNDTSLALDPGIYFSDSPDVFPSELLNTGLIDSGDFQEFNFACGELGAIQSDNAQLVLAGLVVEEADDSAILTFGNEFICGDVIEFRFVEVESDLVIEVRVNGLLVD